MINYTILNSSGEVVQTGVCQRHMLEAQAASGFTAIEGCYLPVSAVEHTHTQMHSYASRRQAEYPPVCDQLDALWHGMNTDSSSRIEPFYSMIKMVKDGYPK